MFNEFAGDNTSKKILSHRCNVPGHSLLAKKRIMPQSYVSCFTHVVFHTKDNLKNIREDIQKELYSYIGGILKNLKSIPIQIGGTTDHMHILCTLPKTLALADLAEEVKKSSSKWIKTKGKLYEKFYWQDGYGGFSVSSFHVDVIKKYILNQKQHHKQKSFMEEYKDLLNEYGIDYDEKYL